MSIEHSKHILNANGVEELVTVVEMIKDIFAQSNDNPAIVKQLEIIRDKLPGTNMLSFPAFIQIALAADEEASDPTTKLNKAAWLERAEAKNGEDSIARIDMEATLAAMFNMVVKNQAEKSPARPR